MKDVLREIGMIARALDSISNIEFKEYDLSNESKFPNVHADYNNNLPLIKLDRNITRLLADLESNGKFRRN